MSSSDAPAFGGTLGELFGSFVGPDETLPYHPVHVRVLTIGDPEGVMMALPVWEDPGGARALHHALRARIEAALLAALSQPAKHTNEAVWQWLRVAFFARVPDVQTAVRAFELREIDEPTAAHRRMLSHLRHEMRAIDRVLPDDPVSIWQVPITLPDGESGERLRDWNRRLATGSGDEVWGAVPGAPFRRLAALIEHDGLGEIGPDRAGLDRLEALVVQRRAGIVRWIPPLVFQALCDAAAVVAQLDLGRRLEWAPCEPEEQGLAPPPLIRVQRADGGHDHVPLGLAVLRWCVMPLQPGEQPDPLGAWLADQLGNG